MGEPIPLATIHDAVLEFLRDRDDIAIFGAYAVNAYVDDARMTHDIDILSTRAADLAAEIRAYLHEQFNIAIRCRSVAAGAAYRVYQVRKPSNRHLVDVRSVDELPTCRQISGLHVIALDELITQKVISMASRQNTPKGMTDRADLFRLLLAFPELKVLEGAVSEKLSLKEAPGEVIHAWEDLVSREITAEDDDSGF